MLVLERLKAEASYSQYSVHEAHTIKTNYAVFRSGNSTAPRVLKPVIVRYQGKVLRIYFRADAALAMPGVYECLEAERVK